MASPLIGVTPSYTPPTDGFFGTLQVGESYIQAVLRAGGIPVMLPLGLSPDELSGLLERLDGLLLTGGSDVDPQLFQGRPHPRVYGITPERDRLEIHLVRMAAESGKPFMGICRGIQVINVALGGTLYTDITDQLEGALRHDQYPDIPRNYLAHAVRLEADSRLAGILGGDRFEVNSLHHQGLEEPAADLRVTGISPDGLIEAVELPDHPFGLGVQWHPEWLQEHEPQRKLFRALVQAAQEQHARG